MKAKDCRFRAFISGSAFMLLVACATPPKPAPVAQQPPAPAAPAAAQPAATAAPAAPQPDDLRAQATELRKKAFDLGIKDVLADDYAAAEAAYSAGVSTFGKDNSSSASSFSDSIAKFRDVIQRGLPLLVAAEKSQASKLRDTAIQKKAGDLFAEILAGADSDFAKCAASESAGAYEDALAGYKASIEEYDVLYKLCDAYNARGFLVAHDFAKWDTSNWSLAENKYASAQSLFSQDARAADDSVDEALLRYSNVRNTAYEYYAADRKKASEAERDRAAGIKSEVAVKDEFDAALALFSKAEADEGSKDYEDSSAEYDKAATAFAGAYQHAKAKMDQAKGELDSLDSELAAVGAAAKNN
jgi:hypothetical protein